MPKQTDVTVRDLTVYEASNGFYIKHQPSGEVAGMGDGVGMFQGKNGRDILAGSRNWWKMMRADLEADYNAFMEAYFPDVKVDEDGDTEERKTCDQCSPSVVNGVFCHEDGCPNDKKTWVKGRGWVLFVECHECGEQVEEGEPCPNCSEGDCFDPAEHRPYYD